MGQNKESAKKLAEKLKAKGHFKLMSDRSAKSPKSPRFKKGSLYAREMAKRSWEVRRKRSETDN